ncbi:MAG: hypothetical protein K9H25_22860 [Rhodospirillum sp.]|nr:hypothetical protein [Rhodospirillum sp.]MCF8491148.1 hypothetical protein [Rhodospirillum sp.]MCF8502602.1 hypothetical protein [Rhodospirillum sp.]
MGDPSRTESVASSRPFSRGRKAWFEIDEEDELEANRENGLEDLPDPWTDGDDGGAPEGEDKSGAIGGGARDTGIETARRPPRKPLPLDDADLLFKGGRFSGPAQTPFKEEDDNKEVKGCLMVLLLVAVVGVGWLLFTQFSEPENGQSPASRSAPPITKVEAIKEKTVVNTPRATGQALARKLVSPPENPEEKDGAPPDQVSTASMIGMPGAEGEKALAELMRDQTATEENSVCLDGRPARRVPSLYGLSGGFAITYGLTATDGPRLEFMPPSMDRSKDVLFYAALGEPKVKGFEGNQARSVPNSPAAVQRVILDWVAGLANGPCDDGIAN